MRSSKKRSDVFWVALAPPKDTKKEQPTNTAYDVVLGLAGLVFLLTLPVSLWLVILVVLLDCFGVFSTATTTSTPTQSRRKRKTA